MRHDTAHEVISAVSNLIAVRPADALARAIHAAVPPSSATVAPPVAHCHPLWDFGLCVVSPERPSQLCPRPHVPVISRKRERSRRT